MKPLFSVIIPCRKNNPYLKETIHHLRRQTFKSFETIIISDKVAGPVSPAIKRNLGAQKAKGKYLAFLDDDSYPDKNWLKNASALFTSNIVAVCGPCLIPPADNIFQKASGLVWSSFLGSGGAGAYRNAIAPARFVDDFPSVNLIVEKKAFWQVKGFNTHHWPGEDTILCLNLTHKLGKKIYYHPSIIVYHHRRSVLISHLQQITRYAIHRGYFAKIYPQTSFRLGYLMPSLSTLYLIFTPLLYHYFHLYIFIPYLIYLFLLSLTLANFILKKNNLFASLLATFAIPMTHLYYGILFIAGLFKKNIGFTPRHLHEKN